MPLIIIALILIIAVIAYSVAKYRTDHDERPVKERYPDIFRQSDNDASKKNNPDDEESKTLYFPTENIETEKIKRNIH